MDRGAHQRLAGKLPALGRALRPLAHDLWRLLSYCLLHDRLTEGCAIASRGIHPALPVQAIDAGKLAHFALGMVWKTSVTDWVGVDGYTRRLDLGPYEDPIRRYLLGDAPFPKHCFVHVYVWPDKLSVVYGTFLPRQHP